MTDDTTKRGPADAARINVNEEHELRQAVAEVGVSKDVRTHLSLPEA